MLICLCVQIVKLPTAALKFTNLIIQAIVETSPKLKMADVVCIKTGVVAALESFLWSGYTPSYRKVNSSCREIVNLISRELLFFNQNREAVNSPFHDERIIFEHVRTVCVLK